MHTTSKEFKIRSMREDKRAIGFDKFLLDTSENLVVLTPNHFVTPNHPIKHYTHLSLNGKNVS